MIGNAIYSILNGDATISSLVSTRIYPDVAPQTAAFPYIVYTTISIDPTDTKEGPSELDIIRIQVDTYDDNYDDAQTLKAAVRTALDRKTGTIASNDIDKIIFTSESNGEWDPDLQIFWVSQDYNIRVKL